MARHRGSASRSRSQAFAIAVDQVVVEEVVRRAMDLDRRDVAVELDGEIRTGIRAVHGVMSSLTTCHTIRTIARQVQM